MRASSVGVIQLYFPILLGGKASIKDHAASKQDYNDHTENHCQD
jgi:hypothetical protein